MTASAFVRLGRIVKTHGLNGEVAVAMATGLPVYIPTGVTVWFVPPPASVRSAAVAGTRPGPKGPLVTFSGVDGIDAARALCGTDMLANAADLPAQWTAPQQAEFAADGMTVVDAARGLLGTVQETIETGANEVWVVEGPYGEVLIPVIDDVVIGIDEASSTIDVRLLPGLLPEEDEPA